MHKVIQYSFIFLLLATVVPAAMGDAFDQTVEQIKTLEAELKQNRDTALQEIETKVAAERETNPLNAPKDQFESNAEYQARLNELEGVLSKIHTDVWGRYLANNKTRKVQVMQLYNRIFQTPLTVTIGTYDANSEYFPITVEVPLNDENQQREGRLYIGKDDARELFNNWEKVIKTGYLSITPGYRRKLVRLKLEIPNLSKEYYFEDSRGSFTFSERTSDLASKPYVSYYVRDYGIRSSSIAAVSPNGKYIARSNDGDLSLWDVSTFEQLWEKKLGWVRGRNIAFSPNGEYLVANSADNKGPCVILFKALSGHEVTRQHIPPATIKTGIYSAYTTHNVAFSSNGQYIAIAAEYAVGFYYRVFLWLWDVNNNRMHGRYSHEDKTSFVTFSPNGEFLAVGTGDGKIIIYDVNAWWTGGKIHQVLELGGQVKSIAFSPNGKYLAADGYYDGKTYITFWDVSSGEKILQMQAGAYEVQAIAFSPSGEYLAFGSEEPNYLSIYRIGTEEITPTTNITHLSTWGRDWSVYGVAWSPHENFITDGSLVLQTHLYPEVHNLDSEIMVEPAQQTIDVVRLTPATLESPPIGTQLSLNLGIVGAQNIAGYQATVQFDSTALQYVESSNGDYLPADAFFITPIAKDNTVQLAASSLAGESNGDGTLATITFEVVAAKVSTVNLFDVLLTDKDGNSSQPQIETAKITEPPEIPRDINRDGVVNVLDLSLVASNFGKRGENVADVNDDGVVNIVDLTLVAAAFRNTAAAPIAWDRDSEIAPTRQQVQQWLREAYQLNLTDRVFQRGILVLEQLLAALTPKETALLPNYPNPFNPETWIPYQLAEPANISISIYAADGKRIRTLDLGHQPVGIYESRSRAAYWDGRNALGESVASGVYFYTLTAGDFTATRKMLIIE